MKVQPRHQLLQIWRGVLDESYDGKSWRWGGREGRNSISDAEQLLCVLAPATAVESFGLDEPDSTSEDVLAALKDPLGDAVDIPRRLLEAVAEYLAAYTGADGSPVFSGEDYFSVPDPARGQVAQPGELTPELRALHVVDSFVVSINLSLAAIGFARQFRRAIAHDHELLERVAETEALASRRLTAAMVALLRSFTVWPESPLVQEETRYRLYVRAQSAPLEHGTILKLWHSGAPLGALEGNHITNEAAQALFGRVYPAEAGVIDYAYEDYE